ncbi:uncharacterized protein LOC122050271 [Zingiber officinale]|uniref:uncharacterized protein LOC122050271 n=1 Tax=Zingiber officinale TaxID=94328 RepID=UPI001C4D0A0C|nr:uncharacterized protein LOC122050271 [Zingiber officinale]
MTKSFLNKLGGKLLQARRANSTISTLGLLSKEEQAAEAIASLEEEEEQPFVAIHKKLRLTEEVPFRDTFGTFVQIPIIPSPISFERGKEPMPPTHIVSNLSLNMIRPGLLIPSSSVIVSATSASQMATTTSASSQPLSLALPLLTSVPQAKRTPCRRSSPSPGPSTIRASTTESTFITLPSSIPSSFSSVVPISTTPSPSLPSSSTWPSSPSIPPPLFRQAIGLTSQMGQASDPPSYDFLQLQGPLAEPWQHSQELLRGTGISNRVDSHSRQAIVFLASSLHVDQLLIALERDNSKLKAQVEALKTNLPPSHIELTQLQEKIPSPTQQIEAMKKELQHQHQLQVDRLNSSLQVETALKDEAISDVSHKNTVLEKVERLHNIFLSDQAQDSASKEFALLQEQEQRKTQDAEISSLQKELEQLKLERDTLKDQNIKLQTEFQSYKEQEEDRWEDRRLTYLRSPAFVNEYVRRIIGTLNHSVTGVIQQLREGGYLSREPPSLFINHRRLNQELSENLMSHFE